MKRSAGMVLALLLATALPGETIPAIHCESLAGGRVNLPDDLHGHGAVLVIGFSRDSQGAARDWGLRLAADYGSSSNVGYYEIAMLAAVPRLARGLVVRAMKKDVSEPGQAHFLPVIENEADWRRLAHFDRPEAAYVVVVDGTGAVRWTTSGPLTEPAYAELKKHLAP